MSTWTLNDGTETKTLERWGIENPRCVFRSLAVDEFTFRIPSEDALAAPTFPYGTVLRLYKDGTLWFLGRVRREQAIGSRRREEFGYVVANAWWELERLTFQQLRCLKTGDFTGTTTEHSTRVVLGQSSVGLRKTTSQVMVEVLNYAITKGSTLLAGAIDGGISFPYLETRDITCAEAILLMARRTPDAVSWVDYSGGGATLNIRRRASLAAASLDLTAATLLTDFEITGRQDLVPPGVRFIFVSSETDGADGKSYARQSTQQIGVPDSVGGIIATIELMGSGSDRPEIEPAGLASSYYNLLQTVPYEGTVSTKAREVDGSLRPGKKLRLTNGRAAWAAMDALIQTVTEDLFLGTTSADFGPPTQLGPQDYVEQLMFNRRMQFSTNFHAVRNCQNEDDDEGAEPGEGVDPDTGASPVANPNAGGDTVANGGGSGGRRIGEIAVCVDGVELPVYVMIP